MYALIAIHIHPYDATIEDIRCLLTADKESCEYKKHIILDDIKNVDKSRYDMLHNEVSKNLDLYRQYDPDRDNYTINQKTRVERTVSNLLFNGNIRYFQFNKTLPQSHPYKPYDLCVVEIQSHQPI